MTDLQPYKIETIAGVNDTPSNPADPDHPDGSYVTNKYNSLVDKVQTDITNLESAGAGVSLANDNTWTKRQQVQMASLGIVSGTVSIDGSLSDTFYMVISGTTTIDNNILATAVGGWHFTLIVVQDGTGGHSLNLDPAFQFSPESPFVPNTDPSGVTLISGVAINSNRALCSSLGGFA